MPLRVVLHRESPPEREGGFLYGEENIGKPLLAGVGVALPWGDGGGHPRPVGEAGAVFEQEGPLPSGAVHQFPVAVAVPAHAVGPGMLPHKQDGIHGCASVPAVRTGRSTMERPCFMAYSMVYQVPPAVPSKAAIIRED